MNDDLRKQALRNAVNEWKQKYSVADDDPLLATVELWEAFLENVKAPDSAAAYHKLRQELEQLEQLSKSFSKQTGELICEIRAVPKLKSDLWMFPYFTVVVIGVGALITGMLIGKFLL